MTFNQIVWKMAKFDYKKYIFYFLCNSFAVMFFFMFSTVYFNELVVERKKLDGIQDALAVPAIALIVLTVFFISYAHHVFIKRRRSELGLFLTLGMSKRDIAKLLLLENGAIGLFAVITGILGGAIFSRLFFYLLMKGVGLPNVPFQLNRHMFMYSIFAFVIVFLAAVGKSFFQILKGNLIDSIKSDRTAETIKLKSPLFGGVGLALMIGSLLVLYFTYSQSSGGYLLLWSSVLLMGLYISLYQFTSFFIELAKKNQPFYFRRLLFLTSLDYKFKQLTSILMLVTVMIMITIFYSTIILAMYSSTEKEAMKRNPFDIAYIQTETKNNISREEFYSIVDRRENPVKKHLELPIYTYYQKNYRGWHDEYVFMSVEDFNQLTSGKRILRNREYLYFVNDEPNFAEDNNQDLMLPIGGEEAVFTWKDTVAGNYLNLIGIYDIYVVSNSEFDFLKKNMDGFESTIKLINTANWKNTANAVGELEKRLMNYNQSTPPIDDIRTEQGTEDELFQVSSKIEDYTINKTSSGILFFVIIFLSVIFFFGTFILLYLNLFSEIDREKAKFKKLHKIGITVKEVKRMISQELMTLFFVPTVLGTILAFLYVVILATDVGGIMKNPEILTFFIIIAGIYQCIQVGYYFYARRKMVLELTE